MCQLPDRLRFTCINHCSNHLIYTLQCVSRWITSPHYHPHPCAGSLVRWLAFHILLCYSRFAKLLPLCVHRRLHHSAITTHSSLLLQGVSRCNPSITRHRNPCLFVGHISIGVQDAGKKIPFPILRHCMAKVLMASPYIYIRQSVRFTSHSAPRPV